jgi:hypothetical protein
MVRVAEPVPSLFVASILQVNSPVWVGIPEINPVEAFTLRPSGRPAAVKL